MYICISIHYACMSFNMKYIYSLYIGSTLMVTKFLFCIGQNLEKFMYPYNCIRIAVPAET